MVQVHPKWDLDNTSIIIVPFLCQWVVDEVGLLREPNADGAYRYLEGVVA